MLRSVSFSGGDRTPSRSGTPIQRLWRYLSTSQLPGDFPPGPRPLQAPQVVDDGHPLGLGNPKIVRQIFAHLDTPDLIRMRGVNLRWNYISCEFLRRRLGPCRLRPSRLKHFLKMMRRSFSSPFGSFAIRIENLSELQIKKFFRRFSPDIVKLRVKIASDEIPDFFNRILNKLEDLEELHLIRIPEGVVFIRAEYVTPSAWVYGVYRFPKLRALTLESDDPGVKFVRNYDKIISQVVNSARNLGKISFVGWDSHFARLICRCGISNPKSFDGWKSPSVPNSSVKDDLIELFYEYGMKFKALKFSIDPDALTFELVMDLTLQTSEYLYHLALKNPLVSEPFQCSVQLRRLITLNLQGWQGPVDFALMPQQFPNLTSLKISPKNFPEENGPLPVLENIERLTVMPLEGMENCPVGEKLMEKLTKMFPNLVQLYIQCEGAEGLHLIYKEWTNLTTLWVDLRGDGGDEGITGIPQSKVKINGHWDCGCSHIAFRDEDRRPTNIGDLRELRELILRAGSLSDISLLEGISKLVKLEVLWLLPAFEVQPSVTPLDSDNENIKFHQMPQPWCLKAIADCFPLLKQLVTSREVVYSEEDVAYLREKLPDLVHDFKL